ncbi:hypothetical protein ABW20_dc0107423 [Dactylellina cionopaga]|nr:hypothetical protein ABW20_dc0107423 [Dactylellina cionopaga]
MGAEEDQGKSWDLKLTISRPWAELLECTLVGEKTLECLFDKIHEAETDFQIPYSDKEDLDISKFENEIRRPEQEYSSGFDPLFENPRFADIELYIGPEKRLVRTHRAILAASSDYFNKNLNGCHLAKPSTTVHSTIS